MKRSLAIAVVVLPVALLVGVALYVDRSRSSAADAAPDLRDPRRIAAGQAIYDGNCAACHGGKLEGQPNGPLACRTGACRLRRTTTADTPGTTRTKSCLRSPRTA
jgi:mono/diheme cytochrome c family protein